MTTEQNRAYDQLVAQWLRHDDLRRAGGSIAELWASRGELDDARRTARRSLQAA